MNREQAENILDAYVLLSTTKNKAASDSLREVILDAMTEYRYSGITWPSTKPMTVPTYHQPIVTCQTEVVA